MFFQLLVFIASMELGVLSGGIYNYTPAHPVSTTIYPIYSKFSGEVSYLGFFIGGQMDCYFLMDTITKYQPFQNTYIINAGYRQKSFEIGFSHSCFHPMLAYSTLIIDTDEIKPKYEGAVEKVYVKFSL